MPKSKRNKQIDLSKTKKHGLEGKKKLFEEVRSCVETYTNVFIFSVNDMRNAKIKSVREQWKHSRFFIGKNKVMAKALGLSPEDEFRMNIHKIGQRLKGERGLLFSNQSVEEVLKWFSSFSEGDYARSGNRATETVILQEGPLRQFPHNLEPYLRQLGLPTTLQKGIIHLVKDHTVCNVGDILTPETAKVVKLLGYEMAEFYIKIECVWSQDGSFSDLTTGEESKENLCHLNSSSVSKQTSNEVASMDVDEEDDDEDIDEEPSDEIIQNITKNSLENINSEVSELEENTKTITNEQDEEISELAEDINACNETSEQLQLVGDVNACNETSEQSTVEDIEVKVSELVEDTKTISNEKDEEISELVEAVKTCNETSELSTVEDVEVKVSELVQDTETISDEEDEEIPELVEDLNADNETSEQSTDEDEKSADEEKANTDVNGLDNTHTLSDPVDENTLKRLSLDKSALQSPIMLEKRPKFSPKMTRSAMKAKKTVSKTSNEEAIEEKESTRGRAHKRHSTGESPIERKLRNRSIKIVKKKK